MVIKLNSLNKRLTITFIIYSLAIILLVSTVAKLFVKKEFNTYIESSINERKKEIINDVNMSYNNGKWDTQLIEHVGMNALENGMIIKIENNFNQEIWNARTHNDGMCQSILSNISENIYKIDQNFNGEYIVDSIDIINNDIKVGAIKIEYYGPFYYRDTDIIYFDALDNALKIMSIVITILSILIGILISKTISKPIDNVINSTNLIAEGNYKNRIEYNKKIIEIRNLVNSVNTMAENLEKQETIRKNLVKDISHELRTPVTTVSTQIEAIKDGIWEPSEERLNSIYEEMQRLSRLIMSLEKLVLFESNDLKLNIELVNIKELIYDISRNFEKQLLDKNINMDINGETCSAYIDKDKLSQAIVNIISNAIKYNNKNGQIIIWYGKDDNKLKIGIKDTGIGISKKDIPYIFDRLYRADESRSRLTGGAGIGLSVTKAIIDAHKGEISVNSEIGKGSEFIIQI